MGFVEGVVWSLLGAVAHTILDVLRKFGAQRLPPADLISLLTLYNAAFAVLGLALVDGHLPALADIPQPHLFVTAVVATAAMGLVAALLYQRAVSIAPLSLTVPYLAFAPVFVVFVSPLFLVGEVPSPMGLVGVTIVSIAGYRLGLIGAADTAAAAAAAAAAHKQHPTSPSKARAGSSLQDLALGSSTANGSSSSSSSGGSGGGGGTGGELLAQRLRQQQQLHLQVHASVGSGGGAVLQQRQHQQQHAQTQQQPELPQHVQQQQQQGLHLRQAAHLPHAGGPEPLGSTDMWHEGGAAAAGEEQQPLLLQAERQQPGQPPPLLQQQRVRASAGGGGGASVRQKSPWAEAYYRQKYPAAAATELWDAARGGLQSAAAQLLASAASAAAGASPRASQQRGGTGAGSAATAAAVNGTSGLLLGSDSSSCSGGGGGGGSAGSSNNSGGGYIDSQAKGSKEGKHADGKRGAALLLHASASAGGGGGGLTAAAAVRRRRGLLPRWLLPRGGGGPGGWWPAWHARWPLLRRAQRLLTGPAAGPAMVLIVAFLYSITASLDKLGMSAAPSTAFYIVCQRLLIAAASLAYLLAASPGTLRHLGRDAVLLVSMSLVEQAAVVLYFKAIQNILVSYMVAIKRINVLLSTLIGCCLFNERVGQRLPYIALMLCGMLLIVLQPGHEALHHSHHTR